MQLFVQQNGQSVTQVAPGSPVHLYADGVALRFAFLSRQKTRFYVRNAETQQPVLDKQVTINILSNAGMDWTAPTTPGTYYFFGDYDGEPTTFVPFTVTAGAAIPLPGGGGSVFPDPGGGYTDGSTPPATPGSGTGSASQDHPSGQLPSWLLPVGIGLVALVLLMPDRR